MALVQTGIDFGMRHVMIPFMATHAGAVLKYGVDLGHADVEERSWPSSAGGPTSRQGDLPPGRRRAPRRDPEGARHPAGEGLQTFEYLGNIGTVSLPLTAALAEEREFLQPGDRVGFLGIGSGLNCLMLGRAKW